MTRIFPGFFQGFIAQFFSLTLCLILAACGGGGGGGGSSSDNSNTGANTNTGNTARTGVNVVPVSVDHNVFAAVNQVYVSVTLCSTTDQSACLTVDHILIDTGSVGLRIFATPTTSAALSSINLTPMTSGGYPVGECLQFVQGNTWGPLVLANVQIGQKTASNAVLQVIGDTSFNAAPSACTSTGKLLTTPNSFTANGVLGIGLNLQDCGQLCASTDYIENIYFSCAPAGCNNITMPVASQVQNPVSLFGSDNNGVIISLESLPSNGAASASGTLTFGVDTQSNNVSGNSHTVQVDASASFTTTFEGQTYTGSYFDSGSNAIFFNPPTNNINLCAGNEIGFYCPADALNLTAQLSDSTDSTAAATINFNIANTQNLLNEGSYAFNNLAGKTISTSGQGTTFDWGIPFFYGRDVYIVFEGSQTTKGAGPYFGF